MKFSAYVSEDCGSFPTFFEAFKALLEKTMELIKQKRCSAQILETAVWIEVETDDGRKAPIMFYDAGWLARDLGIMTFDEVTGTPSLSPPPEDEAGQQAYQTKLADGLRELGFELTERISHHMAGRIEQAVCIGREHGDEAGEKFIGIAALEAGIAAGAGLSLFEAADSIAE